uniref:F-box domain-containing protein n=1 Tax=Schistocephalus solidus TaxID=70667 RepID=A0A0V0J6U8_SCHSO
MADILDLPSEILQRICDNLTICDVSALNKSCKALSDRINSSAFWHRRLFRKAPMTFPCIPGKKVNWMKSCVVRERIMDWFLEEPENCTKVSCFHNPGMCIDALHFLQLDSNLLAAGDRGGTLSLFALTDLLKEDAPRPILSNGHTHKGWIWSITSEADLIASTSWDGKLRLWAYGGTMKSPLSEFKLGSAVLCSEFLDTNLIAATAFHGPVTVHDVRAPPAEVALSNHYHKSAVLTLKSFHSIPTELTQDQFLTTPSERSDDDDDGAFSLSDSISLIDVQSDVQIDPITDQGDGLDAEANSELLDLSPSGDGVPSMQGQQVEEQQQQQIIISKDVTFFYWKSGSTSCSLGHTQPPDPTVQAQISWLSTGDFLAGL